MHRLTAQSISKWDEKVLICKKDAITCDQSRQSFIAIHDFCLLRFGHFNFFASWKMLNEFFHQLEFISFYSIETVSIVLPIFLDCKAKLRQNDSAYTRLVNLIQNELHRTHLDACFDMLEYMYMRYRKFFRIDWSQGPSWKSSKIFQKFFSIFFSFVTYIVEYG